MEDTMQEMILDVRRAVIALVLVVVSLPAVVEHAVAAGTCTTGLTLTVHPGLPAGTQPPGSRPASDIPHGPFSVALPLYPGARPLTHFVASPLWEYPMTPYLQTAVTEYETTQSSGAVRRWYRQTFESCGWRNVETMSTNASVLDVGDTYQRGNDNHLQIDMGFGDTDSAGAYIGYSVLWQTLPPRPAGSYLHGPFRELRIAYQFNSYTTPNGSHHTVHVAIDNRAAIGRLVRAINGLKYVFVPSRLGGGGGGNGPAWLAFIRPNGTRVHVFAASIALQVGHTRTLADDSQHVWNLITALARKTDTVHGSEG
jgi:hypothetical protein